MATTLFSNRIFEYNSPFGHYLIVSDDKPRRIGPDIIWNNYILLQDPEPWVNQSNGEVQWSGTLLYSCEKPGPMLDYLEGRLTARIIDDLAEQVYERAPSLLEDDTKFVINRK